MLLLRPLLISLSILAVVHAGTIDPNISDKQYIRHGQEFTCVGKICGTYHDGVKFCASAVAIDDHHILTAAHVVKDSKECRFIINNKEFCLKNVIYHKNFDSKFGIADIALGYSEQPIGLQNYPELYCDKNEINKLCDICGYGLTGTFNTGTKISDDKKRAGTNTIDEIYEDLLICSPSKMNTATHTRLEFLIGSGDSGGGLFIDGKLAGINSCVMAEGRSPNSIYGDESGHTRVSNYIDWIKQNKQDLD